MPKGYRLSFPHLAFYVFTFIITTQLWTIWRQTGNSYFSSSYTHHNGWEFNSDIHANTHTLSHDQCSTAFPKLYHSLDQSVGRRQGKKVHIEDIKIRQGRCMLRVMVYEGEVRILEELLQHYEPC